VDMGGVVVIAFCSLVALIVIVMAIRPSASSAVCDVLKALGGVVASVWPWSPKPAELTAEIDQRKLELAPPSGE